jgi:hypothetical protein
MIYLEWIAYLFLGLWLTVWVGAVFSAFVKHGIKAWRYAVLSVPFWVICFARYPASIIAVWLFSSPDRLYLTRWKWLETIDNTLAGDGGHQTEHMFGKDPLAWYNRVLWLWRNGGNRFNYWTIGVADATAPDWAFWDKVAVPLIAGRFLDLRFGWSDSSLQGRRKYVLTIRIKTKP